MEDVLQRTGGIGQDEVDAVLGAIASHDTETILKTVRRIEEAGTPLDIFLRQLLAAVRTAMHAAVEKGEPIGSYLTTLDTLLHAIRDVRIAPVPGLVLESALLALSSGESLSAVRSEDKPLASKEKKKEKVAEVKKEAPAATVETPEAPAEEKKEQPIATIEAPELTMSSLREVWDEVVSKVQPAAVKMSLKNGMVSSIDGARVLVSFRSSFHRNTVGNTDASRKVEDILQSIFKRQLRLECVLEGEKNASSAPSGEAVNLAEAAAEIF